MDIHSVRLLMKTKSIYEIPLRVTFYARVSSESDEQLNSLGNQITYYEDLIKRNRNWTYVPGYIDEGLSGISTKKREHFNRMVEDAGDDKFDLVITKEISRFARNTLDSIQYTRQLLCQRGGGYPVLWAAGQFPSPDRHGSDRRGGGRRANRVLAAEFLPE